MDRKTFIKAMLVPAIILLGFIGYNYYTLNHGAGNTSKDCSC